MGASLFPGHWGEVKDKTGLAGKEDRKTGLLDAFEVVSEDDGESNLLGSVNFPASAFWGHGGLPLAREHHGIVRQFELGSGQSREFVGELGVCLA